MREFKYGVGVIATIFLLNLMLVKLSKKSSTKTDFRGKNQKDMSNDGTQSNLKMETPVILAQSFCFRAKVLFRKLSVSSGLGPSLKNG